MPSHRCEAPEVRVQPIAHRQLTEELTRVREQRDAVSTDLTDARRRRQSAARRTAEAAAARERALARLASLEADDPDA